MATPNTALCPVLATEQHGLVTDENLSSLKPSTYERTSGTVVQIVCYVSSTYKLQGSAQVTCKNGIWVPEPPVCVRKDGLPTNTSEINNILKDLESTDSSDSTTTVLLITAIVCAALLFLLVLIFSYLACAARARSRANRGFDELEEDGDVEARIPRAKYLNLMKVSVSTNQSSVTSGSDFPAFRSTWPSNTRAWTYLSVDRLLRDIERSRRENPQHSWRDFASISTKYSTRRV